MVLAFAFAQMASAADWFVATNGNDGAAGTNWATALLTISNAVAQTTDGDTVTVSNGTYGITAQISVTKGITVRGVNGPTNTTVTRTSGTIRIFYLSHTNAVVDGVTITNGYANAQGGGVYIVGGGTVQNCVIVKNSSYYGAGVYMQKSGSVVGTVRNCLIINNRAFAFTGGGVQCLSGGNVESCTIIGNNSVQAGGGVHLNGGGTAKNSIIYFNTAPANENYLNSSGSFTYTDTTPAVGGAGNITGDPLLVNRSAGNYRLLPGSPCIDAGVSNSWMGGAKDLDGNDRILDGAVDIGVYESEVGALACNFTADSLEGFTPHTVGFTNYVAGTNTSGLYYKWDFDNDGSFDVQGSDKAVVTNIYTAGVYSVSLTVTNAIGETASYARTNYIKAGPAGNYVSLSGSHAFPYTSWAAAATNIQAAVDAGVDGTLALVANGTYVLTNQVSISRGVTVRSVNGHSATIVDGNGSVRGFYISDANAVVDGFTIQNCSANPGGGVYFYWGGTAQNCAIVGNTSSANYGGGAYMLWGGTLRNCLIKGNYGRYTGGVAVSRAGALVESCTIVSNRASQTDFPGGVLTSYGGTVRNTIIYDNIAVGSYTNWSNNQGTYSYTCTTPAVGGTGNITNNPAFKNADANDYRLRSGSGGSPCINAGIYQSWMTGATDLGGYNRIVEGTVDMGAYESFIRGMIIKIH